MVERSLCMREVQGSIPCISISVFFFLEWSIQLKQYCVLEDTAIIGGLKKFQLPSELGKLRTSVCFPVKT